MLHPNIEQHTDSSIHGIGLFARAPIREGETVWQLNSKEPTFTLAETEAWSKEKQDEFEWFGFQCGEDRYMLGEGMERYMNHSCDPNTWWGDSRTLIARRNIKKGEEVTYDYVTTDISRSYTMPCTCGAKSCRKNIKNTDYLDTRWQRRYGKRLPDHVLKAIQDSKGKKAALITLAGLLVSGFTVVLFRLIRHQR